jgi:hypothetical protein
MCRAWSLDWALDRPRAEQRLLQMLEDACKAPREAPAKPVRETEPVQAFQTAAKAEEPSFTHPEYKVWTTRATTLSHERFYEASSRPQMSKMMAAVIDREGPVYGDVVRRRVGNAWGLTRMTENVHRIFDAATPAGYATTSHAAGVVFWPAGMDASSYREFRVPSDDPLSRRSIDEIPTEELRNAMREILDDFGECSQDDLYREAIKYFGLSTLTARARKFMDEAYGLLQREVD